MAFFLLILFAIFRLGSPSEININDVHVEGPGLRPDLVVMPARYFFVYLRGSNYAGNESAPDDISVSITGKTEKKLACRLWTNILNRKDSSFIVRYKIVGEPCYDVFINVNYKSRPVSGSPFHVKGPVYPDECVCPEEIDNWLHNYGCQVNSATNKQMQIDLSRFENVDFESFYDKAIHQLNTSQSSSVCHYVIKSNEVYRNCYGQYVGFKMFMDSILLSLTRKAVFPDFEFFSNLGDWPLMALNKPNLFPMFSWCGSTETADIVMPSYDITEASLECMGRVSLDMLSVQGKTEKLWHEKEEKVFWRGRDSSRARLNLIDIARAHPDLFNASLTNFFFFKDEEEKYGPKEKHISFFKFFDYKYLINMDGTVAAYRFPYLLGGDSLIFKQNSNYYEFFYRGLTPWVHYVPVKADLSDLVELVQWAKANDDKAREISRAGQRFARNNLLPQHVICYYAILFHEWSKKLKSDVKIRDGMEHVPQNQEESCSCRTIEQKDEL